MPHIYGEYTGYILLYILMRIMHAGLCLHRPLPANIIIPPLPLALF